MNDFLKHYGLYYSRWRNAKEIYDFDINEKTALHLCSLDEHSSRNTQWFYNTSEGLVHYYE